MSHKLKKAQAKAQELLAEIKPYVEKAEIAGSIRREKPEVKDIEILYIPKENSKVTQVNLFGEETREYYDELDQYIMEHPEHFEYRLNKNGSKAYGQKNKLLIYKGTALDVFTASQHNWSMLMFIRTGGWQLNAIIATLAIRKGLRLKHYEGGFTDKTGQLWKCHNEEQVFTTLDLPYLTPKERTDPIHYFKEKTGKDYSYLVKEA